MDRKSYTYTSLQKEYNYFLNPSLKISVNGKELSKDFEIMELWAELTVDRRSTGSVRFHVSNELKSNFIGDFPLAGKLKIDAGYENKNQTIFEGVIFERSLRIINQSLTSLLVIALDYKSLLRMNNSYQTYMNSKNRAAVVRQILTRNGLHGILDEDKSFDQPLTLTQSGVSDFDYILSLAKAAGFEFFALNQDVYFRKPMSVSEIMITITKESIYRLAKRSSLFGLVSGVVMEGHNLDKKQEKTITCNTVGHKVGTGMTGSELLKKAGWKLMQYESSYYNKRSGDSLKQTAENYFQENSMEMVELTLCMDGLPQLIPGRFLKISKLAEAIDNTYYVETVKHSFERGRFQTELTAKSNTS